MILSLDRFTPQVIARCLHGLPPEISVISIDSSGTDVVVVSSHLTNDQLSDYIFRQCLDEEIRIKLLEETQSERRLIYAYALTGLLPEDLEQ